MSELKAKHVVDVYDEYSANPTNEAQVYLKSEADKVISRQKWKRCLAIAKLCRSEWAAAIFIPEKGGTDKHAALYMKWEKRWRAIANKFKDKEA